MSPGWTMARRTERMNTSAIREILKITDGILSLAGGLPSPGAFPVQALRQAAGQVLEHEASAALQYSPTEGLPALRAWIARRLSRPDWAVDPEQVLITTGSQQGLDLIGKVMLDAGSPVLVEQPTYVGALQAFAPYEPALLPWPADAEGPLPSVVSDASARLAYLVPSFQNPSGLCLGSARRQALAQVFEGSRTLLVEDDPYGELWYDTPPPAPIAAQLPSQVVYLGSLSKVLAPGLRLGYMVVPAGQDAAIRLLRAKLVQAKQAADLHTSSLGQHIVMRLMHDGFDLEAHLDAVRARYRAQRDAMHRALRNHMPACQWHCPTGGMFFWVRGPQGFDSAAHLPHAVAQGVAYVPGAAFFSGSDPEAARMLRLSFVTLSPSQIDEAVARLGRSMR